MLKAFFYYAVLFCTVLTGCVLVAVYFPRSFAQNAENTPVAQAVYGEAPAAAGASIRSDSGIVENEYGSITVFRISTGCTERTDLEAFVAQVLLAELTEGFDGAALEAQAVAARSYLVYHMENGGAGCKAHHGADVCTDSSHCLAAYTPKERAATWGKPTTTAFYERVRQAVQATAGEILLFDGKVANTVFHAMSYGQTESAEAVWGKAVPYLISVPTPENASIPGFVSEVTLTTDHLALTYDAAGRIADVTMGEEHYSGTEFRRRLELRSTCVYAEKTSGGYCLTIYGAGHGVGMSQWGARRYAEAGRNYRWILKHYYPGTVLLSD